MYKIKVDKIHCMSCVRNIEDALKEVDAELILQADIPNQTLTIKSEVPLEEITRLIETAGYPVL